MYLVKAPIFGCIDRLLSHQKITKKTFLSFCKKNSDLGGHPDMRKNQYITASTGSLGHGLPIISGMVFADQLNNFKKKYYIVIGDQECLEGTTWETMFLINKFKLNNLTIIIYSHGTTHDAMPLGDIKKKFLGFSKNIITVNGHSHRQIYKALNKSYKNSNPKIIIAKTIKGNGLKMI